MKLSAVERCCKSAKYCNVWQDGSQWIGDGAAMYRADNLPMLNEDNIKMMWSLSGKKADEFRVNIDENLPVEYSFGPLAESDEHLTLIAATACGRSYLRSDAGTLLAVQEKYLKPFTDDAEDITYICRRKQDGTRYICAMRGVLVDGIIMPLKPLTDVLLRELGDIYNAESVAAAEADTAEEPQEGEAHEDL